MADLRKPDVVTVAVTRVDGGLTLVRVVVTEYIPDPQNPTQRLVSRQFDPTPEYIESLIAKYVKDGHWPGPLAPVSWRFVANDFVNEDTDRTFREAWQDKGNGSPDVEMVKARDIHRDHLRDLRQPKLDALDVDYVRADEHNDVVTKANIAKRKQALRDVTDDPAIDAAQTPDALKAVMPEPLRG